MRALLVANPKATSMTPGTQDVIARALGSDLKVEVVSTRHRGHAAELASEARADGLDLVIALGGDGTVNEVVNGLLADQPSGLPVPALAVVPGGSTNVFVRALGLPRDPVEATSALLQRVRAGRRREVSLGRADGRWFTFAAGVGLDAEVVRRVERHRESGRASTPGLYIRTVAETVSRDRLSGGSVVTPVTVEVPGLAPVQLRMAVFGNTRPWTFVGELPVDPFPLASFDDDLDLFGMRRIDPFTVTGVLARVLRPGRGAGGRSAVSLHGVTSAVVTADRPFPVELDGDAVELRQRLVVESVPRALTVVA
ncbi:diacylglycerol/lipid kinase family protein [Motilibacter rhizosphaerae]|uniref:diacylglycerol/lipid kinase family protein n=1 Tax=Motilibacter rhizosphaerae TaxID=598652 RepID=UPI00102BCCAA|nr:diacylglycerol kinase family protein [Motilibacter rhizosphaerae]